MDAGALPTVEADGLTLADCCDRWAELPLLLQDHNTPVHYRNIWIRKIGNYDEPEK